MLHVFHEKHHEGSVTDDRYDDQRPCVKCGAIGGFVQFFGSGIVWGGVLVEERLEVTCWRCGHKVTYRPLDFVPRETPPTPTK